MSAADDRPTPVPPGEPNLPPHPDDGPTYPDEEDERFAIDEAWHVMMAAPGHDDAIAAGPITGLLFASVALVYERAEGDSPACGVLHAIRETVEGWSRNRGQSTIFASVSFADLALMVRRVDLALAMVRRDCGKDGAR